MQGGAIAKFRCPHLAKQKCPLCARLRFGGLVDGDILEMSANERDRLAEHDRAV